MVSAHNENLATDMFYNMAQQSYQQHTTAAPTLTGDTTQMMKEHADGTQDDKTEIIELIQCEHCKKVLVCKHCNHTTEQKPTKASSSTKRAPRGRSRGEFGVILRFHCWPECS